MTMDRLWWAVAIALPALVALLVPIPAVDLAYQLRAGDEILRTGVLPSVDTYTFTVAGATWLDQQWLAQVLLALVHRAGGWELLLVLRAALVAASTGLLALVAVARGARPRTAVLLALAGFMLAAPALALRPQLLAITLFAAVLLLVAGRHRHPRAAWAIPFLVVAWANIHGSFVLAPIVLGYAWLDDLARGRRALVAFALVVVGSACTLLTPFGVSAWTYAAGIGANPVIAAQATEWQRTSPASVPGILFYLSALAGLAVAFRGRAALRWPDALLLATLLLVGAWAERGLAWWPFGLVMVIGGLPDALAAVPRAATNAATGAMVDGRTSVPALGPSGAQRAARAKRTPGAIAALLLVLVVALLPWWRPAAPLTGRVGILAYAPAGLAGRLRELAPPGTRVLAAQTWTSFLEWAVPDARYFLDSRFELFPPAVWEDRATIVAGGPGAQAVLDRWKVEFLVLPTGVDLGLEGWTTAYEDADGSILARVSTQP